MQRSDNGVFEIQVGENESLTHGIVTAVAALTNEPPEELSSISEVVDPDALEHLFEPVNGGPDRFEGAATFEYAGYRVDVSADRSVTFDSLDETDEAQA